MARASQLPIWRTDGVILTILLHAGPVEFLYYWLHRALHHHYLYSRYHSHHHSSIVTEPITSVVHPFAEHISYFILFAIPIFSTILTQTASLVSVYGYIIFIDFMNNMGHCNFEMVPKKLFSIFPPLKYIMYTPTYHSLHHTKFRTNYSLFMPIYDYMYETMDESTYALHETSLKRQEDAPDVVHLTHLTTPDSIYHLRLGFASVASQPHKAKWYLGLMMHVTWCSMILTCIFGRASVAERNKFKNLILQSWAIPKYTRQYKLQCQRKTINSFIEEAILRAEERGIKVLSLGLLNQGEELNGDGELYVRRHPQLSVKVVNGTSLAAAIVLNSIPEGTTQILFRGKLTKVAHSIVFALCEKGIKVATLHEDEYKKLELSTKSKNNLQLTKSCAHKVWLVGDGLTEEEQRKAGKRTLFIPFSPISPKQIRSDCFYQYTPAMLAPSSLENLDSCENWLPRRVMSASRIAGIVHALEGWDVQECANAMFNIDKVWEASLKHVFRPLPIQIN